MRSIGIPQSNHRRPSPWYVGYGLLWGIEFSCFTSNSLFAIVDFSRTPNDLFNCIMLATLAMTGFVVALLSRKGHLLPEGIPGRWATVCVLVGLLLILFTPASTSLRTPILCTAALIAGIGFSLLTIAWHEQFAYRDAGTVASDLAITLLIGGAICLMLNWFPFWLAALSALGCPLLSLVALHNMRHEPFVVDTSSFATKSVFSAILLSLICAAILQMLFTATTQIPFQGSYGFRGTNIIMDCGIVVAELVFLLIVLLTRNVPSPLASYDVVFVTIGGAFLFLPFLGSGFSTWVSVVVVTCSHFVYSAFLLFTMNAIHEKRASPYTVLGISNGALWLFSLLGVGGGVLFFERSIDFIQLTIFTVVSIYLLAIVLVIVIRRNGYQQRLAVQYAQTRNTQQPLKGFDPDTASKEEIATIAQGYLRQRSEEMAAEYGFTQREQEISLYLAKGYSTAAIAKELFVSTNTVKTHVKMIYTKLDVHSKQELIELFREDIGTGPTRRTP